MGKISCIEAVSKTAFILTKEGLLPLRDVHKFNKAKLILHFVANIFVTTVVTMNIINAIKDGDAMFLNQMICILIPEINLVAKGLTIVVNRERFLSLLDDLNSDAFNVHNDKLNEHIQLVNRSGGIMIRIFTVSIIVCLIVSCVLPIVTSLRILIPSPIELGRFKMLYENMHLIVTTYMGINSICFDVLYVSIMGICIAQLNILRERLIYVYEDSGRIVQGRCRTIDELLTECVILHETINAFVGRFCVILAPPLFIQYTCGCFIICTVVLQLTIMGEQTTSNIIHLVAYTFVTTSQLAVYHWLGNEISFKSNKIIEACYLSKWYEMNRRSQTALLLLMERAKRPLVIEVYKLVFISLESLAMILRWSYSLFALIKARYN